MLRQAQPERTGAPALERTPAALLGLVAVALLVRAWDFGDPILHVDEEWYLLVGDRLLHGARLYLDIWDRKPWGLFAIYAAIRLLPGDGILAYQLVATGCAVATAALIRRGALVTGAGPRGAWAAGAVYLLWLSLLSGRGGQSPVFYNLFTAGAAVLTLRLPALAAARARRAIVANGAAACLLAGLAIQTKYTPAVEGAFFGLAHLWALWRAGAKAPLVVAAAIGWALLGVGPTLAVAAGFWWAGPAAWRAFWFANFTSVGLRRAYPAAKIAARLAGTTTQLLPLIVAAVVAWRGRGGTHPHPHARWRRAAPSPMGRGRERRQARKGEGDPLPAARVLLYGWLAAALVAFAAIGAFFDHYALPLLVPLCIIAAPVFGRSGRFAAATVGWGLALLAFHFTVEPNRDGAGVRAMAAAMRQLDGTECPFVFAGDSTLYLLAHACLPTPYAFPSTLEYEPERGATGVDEAAEVARIMARRPPAVVTLSEPLAPWNRASLAVLNAALARDYRPVMAVPRLKGTLLLYARRAPATGRPRP